MAGITDAGKKKVGIPAIVAAVVVLVGFIAWYGSKMLAPDTLPKTKTAQAYDDMMDRIAKESGGDLSKVKPEELQLINKNTYGHAQEAITAIAKQKGYIK
jgi:hypothetical protein